MCDMLFRAKRAASERGKRCFELVHGGNAETKKWIRAHKLS
jgi:hypothetical protein